MAKYVKKASQKVKKGCTIERWNAKAWPLRQESNPQETGERHSALKGSKCRD
jgi:hypothetical protein